MNTKKGFDIISGEGISKGIFTKINDCLVITQEDIWDKVLSFFTVLPENIYFLQTLEIDLLEKAVRKYRNIKKVVGIGGGRVADVAKFFHWKTGATLYQVPTIISVDAYFTHEIAIRENGVVRYVGDAVPETVFVDYSIIRKAPINLNRSGLGDILSCHTGLFDWKSASDRCLKPIWNNRLAEETKVLLEDIFRCPEQIKDVTNEGIRFLMESLNWIGHQCYIQGHPRFEEGSEHHFVYNLEFITGKHFVHGQAVCLGCYIMALFQENEPEKILDIINRAGIDIRPESMNVSWNDIKKTLLSLNAFVKNNNLPYTILFEEGSHGRVL